MMLTTLIKTLLLPPALQILLILCGCLLWKHYRRSAISCLFLGIISLWGLSTSTVPAYLHQWLEKPFIANTPEQAPEGVDAIVVLGGGRHYQTTEYGGDTLSHHSLWRLRYGAYLAKRWQLPVIVSGGSVRSSTELTQAEIAADFLTEEMGVPVVWQEKQSRTTWENAQLTKQIMVNKGVDKVVLVTHAYHMRRAAYSFNRADITYVPMPTGTMASAASLTGFMSLLPQAHNLFQSRLALHEYLGLVFYRLK